MFPRLRQRLAPTLLDRLDTMIEVSTLGEYGLAEDGRPLALAGAEGVEPPRAPAAGGRPTRDDCPFIGRVRLRPRRRDARSRS